MAPAAPTVPWSTGTAEYDFFVRHLHGVEPPDWNRTLKATPTTASR